MSITAKASLEGDLLGTTDRARFWRDPLHDGLECLTARFATHRYALHTHDTYVVGIIVRGCETFRLNGVRLYAGAGAVCFVNPGDVHDGAPATESFTYRMTYPSTELMRSIAADLFTRAVAQPPMFRVPVVYDPDLFAMLHGAHRTLEAGGGGLGREQRLRSAYAAALLRYGDVRGPRPAATREPGPVGRVRDYLEARFDEDVRLDRLAEIAGLTRHHLIRAFRRETGLTPHAYLVDRRIRAARLLLADGSAPADVAVRCGFCDQSHLNRAFKARMGVTPGSFRAAH